MNKDQILIGLYNYLIANLPPAALELIIVNDIRVENFFAIHTGVYLDGLVKTGQIKGYSFQHTILLQNPRRAHIDISFTDSNNIQTFLELKHFSISQNRGQGRGLSFYTGNSFEMKKVGIIGDCEKLDNLRNSGHIDNSINLICCAFITCKPTKSQIEVMTNSFKNFQELNGWEIIYPVNLDLQHTNLGIMTLQKMGIYQVKVNKYI
jgi:hypothetical protein